MVSATTPLLPTTTTTSSSNGPRYPLYTTPTSSSPSCPLCCCSRTRERSRERTPCGAVVRPSSGHRGAYLVLVLVPYTLLVLLFHSQLQLYDTRLGGVRGQRQEEGAFIGESVAAVGVERGQENVGLGMERDWERDRGNGGFVRKKIAVERDQENDGLVGEKFEVDKERHPVQDKSSFIKESEVNSFDREIAADKERNRNHDQDWEKGVLDGEIVRDKDRDGVQVRVFEKQDNRQDDRLQTRGLMPQHRPKYNRLENDSLPLENHRTKAPGASNRHIQDLLALNKYGETRDMFESRWNRSATWSSVYPMSPKCANAAVTKEVPVVRFRPLQSHWVYTAYYDPRPSVPVVRVIILAKKVLSPPAFFCHFANPLNKDVLSVIPEFYEMCENHAKDFGGWILTCKVPEKIDPPCEVTISDHSIYAPDVKSNIKVPVFRTETDSKQDFGVCIPPIFGYIPSTTLVEFIEMTRLLGASHLVFYAHQASREIQKVLRYYDQLGVLTVIQWDLPVEDKSIWYHGQLLAINDCLYRNMHRFKYIAFNDLDEFIVPHSLHARNWTHMIQAIEKAASAENSDPNLHCGYSFHSAFFDPLSSGSRVLYDLESDLRTKALSTVRTKTMVRPDRMFELGIHHISRPISKKFQAYYVSPNEAYVHHYRKCVTDFDPRMNCQVFARDETLSPYIPSLRHNVHQALWVLKEREKLRT